MGLDESVACLHCEAELPYTFFWLRRRNPMAVKLNERVSERMLDGAFEPFVDALALFFYRGESSYKRIPVSLKYHGDLPAGRFYASQLAGRIASAPWLSGIDAVVPVPLHPLRRLRRGYNQAGVIAREIAVELGVAYVPRALRRIRYTRSQTTLSVEDKKANVRNAFRTRPALLPAASHVLLVDDTFTTGSTLCSCLAVLRAALPAGVKISVATLCYVGQ